MIEKDNIVLITGKRGSGKTTIALKIILGFDDLENIQKEYNEELNIGKEKTIYVKLKDFTSFDMDKDMAFQRKELQELCQDNRKGFVLADEAVVNVARRNAMSRANKLLHQILTINRKNFNSVFFCLPSVEDFDLAILQYITIWIHVDDRGLACVMLPKSSSIFGKKTWDIDKMRKTYEKYLEDNPRATVVPYWLFDNFRGYIRFSKLPNHVEEKYIRIAHEKKNKDVEEEESTMKRKPRIDEEKMTILKNITDQIIKGEITDPAKYYKNCGELGFQKIKLNKEVNELLAASGDGRTATKAIKDNHHKKESKKEIFKSTRYKI